MNDTGSRNRNLFNALCVMRGAGKSDDEILRHALESEDRCGLPTSEVRQIVKSVCKYEAGHNNGRCSPGQGKEGSTRTNPIDTFAECRNLSVQSLLCFSALGFVSDTTAKFQGHPRRNVVVWPMLLCADAEPTEPDGRNVAMGSADVALALSDFESGTPVSSMLTGGYAGNLEYHKWKIVGFRARRADNSLFGKGEAARKALSNDGGRLGIMIAQADSLDTEYVLVTEGETDGARAVSAGFPGPVLATPGATAGAAVDASLARAVESICRKSCQRGIKPTIILSVDGDKAGFEFARRIHRALTSHLASACNGTYSGICFITPENGVDLDKRLVDMDATRQNAKMSELISSRIKTIKEFEEHVRTIQLDPLNILGAQGDKLAAIVLARLSDGRAKYVIEMAEWLIWHPSWGYWRKDVGGVAIDRAIAYGVQEELLRLAGLERDEDRAKAIRSCARQLMKASGIKSTKAYATAIPGMSCNVSQFDNETDLLPVRNGIVNLRTGAFRPPEKSDMFTRTCNASYDPMAKADRWRRFLSEIFVHNDGVPNPKYVEYVQRVFGYMITGLTREQIVALFWGRGSNGKSVFSETIKHVLGDFFASIPSGLFVIGRGNSNATPAGNATPELMALKGARIAMASETPDGCRLNESVIKNLSGSDMVVARPLFREQLSFKPTHKLVLLTNRKPRTTQDPALWRRMKLFPFSRIFSEAEKDPNLQQELTSESSGILNWLIEGAIAYYQFGLGKCELVERATRDWMLSDDVVGAFIMDACIQGEEHEIAFSEFVNIFTRWIQQADSAGARPPSGKWIAARLEERGLQRIRRAHTLRIRGIDLSDAVRSGALFARPDQGQGDARGTSQEAQRGRSDYLAGQLFDSVSPSQGEGFPSLRQEAEERGRSIFDLAEDDYDDT